MATAGWRRADPLRLVNWTWELTRHAERQMFKFDLETRRRILQALDRLISDPPSGDVRKLHGNQDEWRLRVGDWRVRFRYDQARRAVIVTQVLRRNEGTYRG